MKTVVFQKKKQSQNFYASFPNMQIFTFKMLLVFYFSSYQDEAGFLKDWFSFHKRSKNKLLRYPKI